MIQLIFGFKLNLYKSDLILETKADFKKILILQFLRGYKISKLLIETILRTFFYVKKLLSKKFSPNGIYLGDVFKNNN